MDGNTYCVCCSSITEIVSVEVSIGLLVIGRTAATRLADIDCKVLDCVHVSSCSLAAQQVIFWLCLRDGNTPNCATTQNDCMDYGGVDRIGPILAQPENYLLCCEATGGYMDTWPEPYTRYQSVELLQFLL